MRILPKSVSAYDLNKWLDSETDLPTIIDVREDSELEIVKFPYSFLHMPMSQITIESINSKLDILENTKIVAFCHMGVRSLHFGQWMLDNDFVNEIWNLEEGIDGWSKYIDSTLNRY